MKSRNKRSKSSKTTKESEWWSQHMDESLVRAVLPFGPRFQADLPNLITDESYHCDFDTYKWISTRIWSPEKENSITSGDVIGKGRPEICECESPETKNCIKQHITEKRSDLRTNLGAAFQIWKFDEMGEEEELKLWSSKEQTNFEALIITESLAKHPHSKINHRRLLDLAKKRFPGKGRKRIINYYFNVYVPKRICRQITAGIKEIDSDNDDDQDTGDESETKRRTKRQYLKIKK